MKRISTGCMVALFVVLMAAFAYAETPELRGTWVGDSKISMNGKFSTGRAAYVINQQDGPLFSGYKMYFNPRNVLTREAFAGIFDGGELILGEGKDGYATGYLTAKQHMMIRYVEAGSGMKAILLDLERIHFTTGFVEIDKDGNNVIMRAEITNHYPLNAERILKEADKNGDGKLTKKEWEAWKKANDWKE